MEEIKKEGEEQTPETPASEDKEKAQLTTEIDYKAELEKAQKTLEEKDKRIGQAEHIIEKLKRDKKEEEGEDRTQEIADVVDAVVAKRINPLLLSFQEDKIRQKVQAKCQNLDETDLTLFHLKNSIVSSGDLELDIENAKAIANKNRLNAQLSEAQRALKSKGTQGDGGGDGGGIPPKVSQTPKLTNEERKFIGDSLQTGGIKVQDGKLVSSAKERYFKKIGKPVPQN